MVIVLQNNVLVLLSK